MTIKKIDPRALGSITTGVLLLDGFSNVHEAITHVLGREVYTHELPSLRKEASAAVLRQFPDMPTSISGGWKETAASITERFGTLVDVEKGHTVRTDNQIDTLNEALLKARS